MMTLTTVLSVWTTLDQVRSTVITGKLGAIMSISAILAAMMASIALIKVSSEYIQGHKMSLWKLIRPLVLLAVVCQFNTLVLNPVNSVVNIFTRDLSESVNISTKEYISQWSANMIAVEKYALKSAADAKEEALQELADSDMGPVGKFFTKFWEGIKKFVSNMLSVTSFGVGTVIGGILFLFVKILLFAQQVLCSLYLTLMGLLGPVIFAISILNGFISGVRNWFARYIQIAMWIPIGYLILYINLQIGNSFLKNISSIGGTDLSTEWFMIALQIVALVSVASVPKIANWIVESTGSNDAHGSISNTMRSIGRKLIKF